LVAGGGEIDDREAPLPQRDARSVVAPDALVVRAAVGDRADHRGERRPGRLASRLGAEKSCNSTHLL
jgi:hypothetical protein